MRLATAIAAVAAGALVAWWLWPVVRVSRAVERIGSADAQTRRDAWVLLLATHGGAAPEAALHLADINDSLARSRDPALLDGALALRSAGLWTWSHQPRSLLLREIALRSRGSDTDALLAVELVETSPLELDAEQIVPVAEALLGSASSEARERALAAAFGWAGSARAHLIPKPNGDDRLERLWTFARDWALQTSAPPETRSHDASAKRIHFDPSAPADARGAVFAAVLLAERVLPRAEASDRAETWIRSFDDDQKRAGALLAALLGVHRDLLERAAAIEDVPAVRTAQRLALGSLGAESGAATREGDPIEFAHRTLRAADGDFDPDTVLAMLIAGRVEALRALTSTPRGADARAQAERRARLIERFVPSWHAKSPWPDDADEPSIALAFERLEARRMLEARRLRYDAAGRTFALDATTPAAPGAAAPGAAAPAP